MARSRFGLRQEVTGSMCMTRMTLTSQKKSDFDDNAVHDVFYYHNTLQHSKVIENKTIVAILLLYWFVMLPFQAVTQNTS